MNPTLDIIAEDKYAIAYRPKFTALCDSALAAILLQEMIYFWKQKEGKPFYKFKDACDHDLYRDGDSWCETLGFNKHEFDTALKVIGTKIKKGVSKNTLLATEYPVRTEDESLEDFYKRFTKALAACVIYWTDRKHLTWYQVNERLLSEFVHRIYIDKVNGARQIKSSIVQFRSLKAWEQRRQDSSKVSLSKTSTKANPKVVIAPVDQPAQPQAPAAHHDDDKSNILPIEKSLALKGQGKSSPDTRNGHTPKPAPKNPLPVPGGSPQSDNPPLTRVMGFWTDIRTGVPTEDKIAEQRAEILADLEEYGEAVLTDALKQVEAKLPGLKGVWSWNFVRSFYPSKAELAKRKPTSAKGYTTGKLAAFIDNDPNAPLLADELGDTA